jgi:hypothetical protein
VFLFVFVDFYFWFEFAGFLVPFSTVSSSIAVTIITSPFQLHSITTAPFQIQITSCRVQTSPCRPYITASPIPSPCHHQITINHSKSAHAQPVLSPPPSQSLINNPLQKPAPQPNFIHTTSNQARAPLNSLQFKSTNPFQSQSTHLSVHFIIHQSTTTTSSAVLCPCSNHFNPNLHFNTYSQCSH